MSLLILIITLELILMASDSAVTVFNKKAFNGVRKIFNLDNQIPIGIMINGPSRFCGVSFEKLIEEFKCEKFKGKYSPFNVKENLIEFLENKDFDVNIENFIKYNLAIFKRDLKYEFEDILEDEFDHFIKSLKLHEVYPFLTDYLIDFDDILPDFVKNTNEINEILLKAFSQSIFEQSTEVIISGFDQFNRASYMCFKLIAKTSEKVIYEIVNFENNIKNPLILTFGDDDEVKMFLNGILPEFEENIYEFLDVDFNSILYNFISFLSKSKKFDKKTIEQLKSMVNDFKVNKYVILNDLKNEMNYWKRDRYFPIFTLTNSLPESVLIEFIIFLINIASNKRKFSLDVENIGGNVLVAVIKQGNVRFVSSENINR